jgi:hypothetical protein
VWRIFEDEVSFARVSGLPRELQPGDHAALVYAEEEQAADFCVAYLRDGAARGERLVLVLPERLQEAVISRMEDREVADAVVLDSSEVYGPGFDPDATARQYDAIARAEGPVRLLSGLDPAHAPAIDADTFQHYERIAHQLVLELNATALCVYDGRRLPIGFSPVAVHTHPLISRDGGELRRNADFAYEA